jgi:hypothetical protein
MTLQPNESKSNLSITKYNYKKLHKAAKFKELKEQDCGVRSPSWVDDVRNN